jgi:hypothetical protein
MLIPTNGTLNHCPNCSRPTSGLVLFPMSFREIDEARKTSSALANAPRGRGRKRKGSEGGVDDKTSYISERRTGRWTTEEMTYCDKLIDKFSSGELPIANGIKLNEFLGNMLKSKQSRLTKKMKNAKLSSKTFQRASGGIMNIIEAREFSELEDSFFQGIHDHQERAEIKFHMQRDWREQFSQFCISVGQPLDADAWLSSVEEMDRRASQAKDAARMAKRKMMMGFALHTDCKNPDHGVFIEKTEAEERVALGTVGMEGDSPEHKEMLMMLAEESKATLHSDMNGKSSLLHSAPFLAKTIAYLQRHNVPFEHVDLWVPSFVPADGVAAAAGSNCRLCYAGSATVEEQVGEDGKTHKAITADDQFNLFAFGDYSQKFSFDVGCGLPGRVYESGRPTWEQSVHNAPHHHFERCGGANQWGIKTVLGIPIASPNVGRIVVTLYSCHDRPKDQELVGRLSDEFTRVSLKDQNITSGPSSLVFLTRRNFSSQLMPSPKWKLVVDVGETEPVAVASAAQNVIDSSVNQVSTELSDVGSESEKASSGKDTRIDEVVSLLGELMPSDPNSTFAPYLSGFMSLRLLLLRPSRSPEEDDLARTMLDSYSSYSHGGRSRTDIGVMLARDFMFLNQQKAQQPSNFFSVGQSVVNPPQAHALSGYSPFGFSAPDIHNSPTLAPIPIPGNDSMSIVSN